ncbi:MAG: RNB domain-containing ribonuclease, partial [bacterium]|nr:RNB domain-containing ribonuclease [bacterium]
MLKKNSLVLYKNRPARVITQGEKSDVQLENGSTKKVRPKDVIPLHPGPINSLKELTMKTGDIETAWELLAGESTQLEELCELVFDEFTPAAAWATCQLLEEALHFRGTPEYISVSTAEEVESIKTQRETKAAEKKAWAGFLERVKKNNIIPEDFPHLEKIEQLAKGKNVTSPLLKELSISATPENAHALLLRLKRWDLSVNPFPYRFDMTMKVPDFPLPELPEEERMDLTHLEAFAIDDEGSEDPDDAISYDGERFWIHIADVSALVAPNDESDLEARKIAANLYLPECKFPMLPPKATKILGLGLQETSPSFSFGLKISDTGEITDMLLTPSRVKVTRTTYARVQDKLEEEPFKTFFNIALKYQARRLSNNAVSIDLPEVKLRVIDGNVKITPLPSLKSRELVAEAMFMAGEAAARFAIDNKIPFPFTNQEAPDAEVVPTDMAGMFAFRKKMRRSKMQTVAKPHSGLGLDVYARVTSPLRRYLDLVVHQQLRAFLKGEPLLDDQELMLRVGAAESVLLNVTRAERFSNKYWTLVYLKQNPQWEGEGILVDILERSSIIMIPELGLDVPIHPKKAYDLNSILKLSVSGIDLTQLSVHLRIKN